MARTARHCSSSAWADGRDRRSSWKPTATGESTAEGTARRIRSPRLRDAPGTRRAHQCQCSHHVTEPHAGAGASIVANPSGQFFGEMDASPGHSRSAHSRRTGSASSGTAPYQGRAPRVMTTIALRANAWIEATQTCMTDDGKSQHGHQRTSGKRGREVLQATEIMGRTIFVRLLGQQELSDSAATIERLAASGSPLNGVNGRTSIRRAKDDLRTRRRKGASRRRKMIRRRSDAGIERQEHHRRLPGAPRNGAGMRSVSMIDRLCSQQRSSRRDVRRIVAQHERALVVAVKKARIVHEDGCG